MLSSAFRQRPGLKKAARVGGLGFILGGGLKLAAAPSLSVRALMQHSCLGRDPCWQRLIDTPVLFGVGHGPVDGVMITHARQPGEGFPAVVAPA